MVSLRLPPSFPAIAKHLHRRFFLPFLLSLLTFCGLSQIATGAERPHIVFVLADDLGYGDVQALNPGSKIPTPNLNQLAAEGMTFTDAHSPSAVCTPTRYATLTGRYCWRSRLTSRVLHGYDEPLIEAWRPTVASFLKEQGYHTGIVGKWHLGLGMPPEANGVRDWSKGLTHSPNENGFDESYIVSASLDMPPYIFLENHAPVTLPTSSLEARKFPAFMRGGERAPDFEPEDVLDHLLAKAQDFIRKQAAGQEPFFLYFPLTAPHKPVIPHPRFQGKTGLGPYGDFVHQVDWTMGELLKTLKETGISDNTLLVFTSDNGSFMHRLENEENPDHLRDESVQGYHPSNHTPNGPYRGTKADIWEAGHRVPFFVRWPAAVKAGSRCDRTVSHVDFFATAAEVIGAELPSPDVAAPDSFSLLTLLQGKEAEFKRPPVIHHSAAGMFAIREGEWKLVLGNGSGGREKPAGTRFERPWSLYNLKSDEAEADNRIEYEPERALKLETEALKIIADGKSRDGGL